MTMCSIGNLRISETSLSKLEIFQRRSTPTLYLRFQINFLINHQCKTQSEFSDIPTSRPIFLYLFRRGVINKKKNGFQANGNYTLIEIKKCYLETLTAILPYQQIISAKINVFNVPKKPFLLLSGNCFRTFSYQNP